MNKLAQINFDLIYRTDHVGGGKITIDNSLNIAGIIAALLPYIFATAGIILLLFLLSAGFQLMTSAGDPKKVQMAQTKIKNAGLGFLVVFAAYWIIQIIGIVFKIDSIISIF